MATLGGGTVVTLADHVARTEDGTIAQIVEVLERENAMLSDMPWREANEKTTHVSTQRTGLPAGTYRRLNQGVPNEKSTVEQQKDTMGMLESYSEVDKSLADMEDNKAAFLLSEAMAFVEGMGQTHATTVVYGSEAEDEKFVGLAPRYDKHSGTDRNKSSYNVIAADSGASGADQTSAWLISWSQDKIFGIFPKGSKAGLQFTDLGQETLTDSNSNKYEGYRSHFKWDAGLVVRDWRYAGRVCNIDTSALVADAATGSDLIESLIRLTHKVKKGPNQVLYVNETVETYLDLQTYNASNMNVSYGQDQHGQRVMMFRGIPVKRMDAIVDTESVVSAA